MYGIVELKDAAIGLDRTGHSQQLKELVQDFAVEIEVVKELPANAAGKHRHVILDFSPDT